MSKTMHALRKLHSFLMPTALNTLITGCFLLSITEILSHNASVKLSLLRISQTEHETFFHSHNLVFHYHTASLMLTIKEAVSAMLVYVTSHRHREGQGSEVTYCRLHHILLRHPCCALNLKGTLKG